MKDRFVNIFRIDEQLIALPVGAIQQIVRSANTKYVKGMPSHILGFLNLHGDLLPVVNLRFHLGLENKNLMLEDRFVIVAAKGSTIPFW